MRTEWIAYMIAIVATISIEHHLFAHRWRRHELARRTLGIATVLGLAAPLALCGAIDLTTYIVLWCGFGTAGAVTAFFYVCKRASNEARAESIRDRGISDGEAGESNTGGFRK